MHVYTFFSVHEWLFHPTLERLRDRYGARRFSGFVWGEDQAAFLRAGSIDYAPLLVFTRDVLPRLAHAPSADLDALRRRERRYGVSIHRMLWAERHLLQRRTYDEALQLAEALFDLIERTLDEARPDCIFSEDVSCLASYIHFVVARDRGIPFVRVGGARMPGLLSVYDGAPQQWNFTRARFAELRERGLTDAERRLASTFVEEFRARPQRPSGMAQRAKLPFASSDDRRRLAVLRDKYRTDPDNPTLVAPGRSLRHRALRLARSQAAARGSLFERPVPGERFVLFPTHFQPEASTLVQAPYYLDQAALIDDLSKSLPVGHRLYVKEHLTNRGRRPLSFYRRIRETLGVRLLGPDEDTFALIRDAAAVAVITGTVGWEGLLLGKPVVSFGEVFFNMHPGVYRAGRLPKDEWYGLFERAIYGHHHDEELLLQFVAAIQQTSQPGAMRSPTTFPSVLTPERFDQLADAIVWGLREGGHGDLITETPSAQARAT